LAECTPPEITLGSNPTICAGTTNTELSYTSTSGSPNEYRIDFDDAGFTDVNWSALPASPIPLILPAAAASGTYNATLWVRNDIDCESGPVSFTITIEPDNTINLTSGNNIQPVCINDAIQNITYIATGATGADIHRPAGWGNGKLFRGRHNHQRNTNS
jgi:large repetitive protein